MKSSNFLIRGLRAFFGAMRWVILICVIFGFFICFMYPSRIFVPAFETVGLSSDSASIRVILNSSNTDALVLRNLEGTLVLMHPSTGSEILSLARWAHLLPRFLEAGFTLLLFHLLWRLCSNAEHGEIFSENNIKLVRTVGGLLIVYTLLFSLINAWSAYRIGRYVDEHVSIESIKSIHLSLRPSSFNFHLDAGLLVTGLLVLALAEVFRHGLALKQDTDLTV